MIVDSELYHDGKPRRSGRYPWGSGLRPFQSLKEGISRRSKKSISESPKEKPISELTDDELRTKIARLRLEQDYKKLVAELNPEKKSMVDTFIEKQKKTIPGIIDKAIDDIGTQGAKVLLGEAINRAAGREVVNPKHGQKDK